MQKRYKGLLVGVSLALLLMVTLLSINSLEVIFIISIFCSILFYFFLDVKKRKKYRYYLISFILITSVIFADLVYIDQLKREHSGNVFYEHSNSVLNTGNLNQLYNPNIYEITFPDDDDFFKMKTDYFGNTTIFIDITFPNLSKNHLINCCVALFYYYDNNIKSLRIIDSDNKFPLIGRPNCILGRFNFTYLSKQYSYEYINYLSKIYIETNLSKNVYSISAIIRFSSNIDLNFSFINFSYELLPPETFYSLPSGDLGFGTFLLAGGPLMGFSALIISCVYLLLIIISFIWQNFNIPALMVILYAIIGFILLFWYIYWTTSGHYSDMGLSQWAVDCLLAFCLWNDNLFKFIITLISISQWAFSVGMVIAIMLFITFGIGKIFLAKNASVREDLASKLEELESELDMFKTLDKSRINKGNNFKNTNNHGKLSKIINNLKKKISRQPNKDNDMENKANVPKTIAKMVKSLKSNKIKDRNKMKNINDNGKKNKQELNINNVVGSPITAMNTKFLQSIKNDESSYKNKLNVTKKNIKKNRF